MKDIISIRDISKEEIEKILINSESMEKLMKEGFSVGSSVDIFQFARSSFIIVNFCFWKTFATQVIIG